MSIPWASQSHQRYPICIIIRKMKWNKNDNSEGKKYIWFKNHSENFRIYTYVGGGNFSPFHNVFDYIFTDCPTKGGRGSSQSHSQCSLSYRHLYAWWTWSRGTLSMVNFPFFFSLYFVQETFGWNWFIRRIILFMS